MPYVVTSPITHLGRAYKAGDAFDPMPHEIGQLVASGCIKEVPPPIPVEAKPATKPSQPAAPRGPVLSVGD